MVEKHKPGQDGLLQDGVSHYPASAADLATFDLARDALRQMRTPLLHRAGIRHEYLFVPAFDGTWNDAEADPEHRTNVALIRAQIETLGPSSGGRIEGGYVNGAGTQDNFFERALDGALGYTYQPRLERMYAQFIRQAAKWRADDPGAQIRVAVIGFSRGGEQAAGFTRLLHERGIQDWTGEHITRDEHGHRHIEYTKPPLVPPGQTAQVLGLFDPVGTGVPRAHDRRPPPSVISGFQISARDERRNLFQSTAIIDQGMSVDGRFLAVTVAGAHSNVGNGLHRNGLAIRSGNLMVDYLNSLSDAPFLRKSAEPDEPGLNVIHRSEEGMWFYGTSVYERSGERGRIETLAPSPVCRVVVDCRNAEPRDEALAARFEFRQVAIGPLPSETPAVAAKPGHADVLFADSHLHRQAIDAVRRLEAGLGRGFDASSERLAASSALLAHESGLQRIDHVLLSTPTDTAAAGEHFFVVQGDPTSPGHLQGRMATRAALETPASTTLARMAESVPVERILPVSANEQALARPQEARQPALAP